MDRFSVTQAIQPKANDGQSPASFNRGRLGARGPLHPEARQMVVVAGLGAPKPSRIVQWRVPICAAIVTQFVTHIWCDLSTPSESLC